ncbi:hypothetical protein MKX03_028235 [Papaver bracteatum]|nr:hypothetical protein MKX03_028235 [Papaver bracteatum]
MRRRSLSTNPADQMERLVGKNQQTRICALASLSAAFWFILFYFHFSVLNNGNVVEKSLDVEPQQPQHQPINQQKPPSHYPIHIEPKKEIIKPVEYLFTPALKTIENKSDPCGGRYIYVHDLPSQFNEDMLKECKSLSLWTNMCKFTSNAGLGPPLENIKGVFSNTGWYATNHFAVDVIFSNRMKQYECLTKDSSIAAAVFVPFYAGLDISRYLWGHNISTRDAASLALVDWITKRPEITWDFRRLSESESDWGNKLLFLPAAKNMPMFVVESSPWNANDFAIPYPTYFHPAKDAEVFTWQDRMRMLEHPFLFSFAGAPRPDNPKSIRGQLINQCRKSNLGNHSPSSIMQMFQSSIFFLQPQGDSYTRRSAFDSMLAGCIPVFFHPGSAYTQYTWHLPRNFSKYSVFIPEDDVHNNISIEQRLLQFSAEDVKTMREEVINRIPGLIYADPRSRRDIIAGCTNDDFIEENIWKYELLEAGQREVGSHEWDPFFSKPKSEITAEAEAAKNSWKNEQRDGS